MLARKSLAPIERLRRLTNEITAERLNRRLPIDNPKDELGLLAATINEMSSRLERSFNEVRRFTADASHELRTPITDANLQPFLSRGDFAKPHSGRSWPRPEHRSIHREYPRRPHRGDQLARKGIDVPRSLAKPALRPVTGLRRGGHIASAPAQNRPVRSGAAEMLITAPGRPQELQSSNPRPAGGCRHALYRSRCLLS